MKKIKIILIATAVSFGIIFLAAVATNSPFFDNVSQQATTQEESNRQTKTIKDEELDDIDSWMPDTSLQHAVSQNLIDQGIMTHEQTLTEARLKKAKELDLSGSDIGNLEGLQYAKNLKTLIIEDTSVKNITVLSKLKGLNELTLRDNPITNYDVLNKTKINNVSIEGEVYIDRSTVTSMDGKSINLDMNDYIGKKAKYDKEPTVTINGTNTQATIKLTKKELKISNFTKYSEVVGESYVGTLTVDFTQKFKVKGNDNYKKVATTIEIPYRLPVSEVSN